MESVERSLANVSETILSIRSYSSRLSEMKYSKLYSLTLIWSYENNDRRIQNDDSVSLIVWSKHSRTTDGCLFSRICELSKDLLWFIDSIEINSYTLSLLIENIISYICAEEMLICLNQFYLSILENKLYSELILC